MAVDTINIMENLYHINSAPMKIPKADMIHLHDIYNSTYDAQLFKNGRQTHKSTTVCGKIVTPCVRYANYKFTYIAPTQQQVSVFSTDKLDSFIHGSPILREALWRVRTKIKDQVFYKEFPNGSRIYLRSAYHTADSSRGISNDGVAFDEVQDILSEHLPVIQQSTSHSLAHYKFLKEIDPYLPKHLFGFKLYAGTPKTVDNTMEKLWDNSTAKEWIVHCHHTGCKKWNYIDEKNIGITCLICKFCGKPIYYENGQWVITNSKGFIDGYRMPQIVLNWINDRNDPAAWKKAITDTMKEYTTERVFNEILALPYANAKHPMSRGEVIACCRDYGCATEYGKSDKYKLDGVMLTAGIDWGKGDTASGSSYSCLTIGGYIKGMHRVIFMKKYKGKLSDALIQITDMLNIIRMFQVKFVLADTGDGRVSNAMMVEALTPLRFAEIMEHGTLKEKIKWDGDLGHYIMNRTRIMTDIMMEIKRSQISFFRKEEFEPYVSDFTGIYAEYSELTRQTKYDHLVPDDMFHSYMFERIASMIISGELERYIMG